MELPALSLGKLHEMSNLHYGKDSRANNTPLYFIYELWIPRVLRDSKGFSSDDIEELKDSGKIWDLIDDIEVPEFVEIQLIEDEGDPHFNTDKNLTLTYEKGYILEVLSFLKTLGY